MEPKRQLWQWLAVGAFGIALYVLSIGPGYILLPKLPWRPLYSTVYWPILAVCRQSDPCEVVLCKYLSLCTGMHVATQKEIREIERSR